MINIMSEENNVSWLVNLQETWLESNAIFLEAGQTRKHCFLGMYPEGGQTKKHCFQLCFLRQTNQETLFSNFSAFGKYGARIQAIFLLWSLLVFVGTD